MAHARVDPDAVVEYSLLSDVGASVEVEGTTRVRRRRTRAQRSLRPPVVLSNLEPGATYKYRVGNPATEAYSRWFDFVAKRSRAQIAAGPPLKLLALCDQGHRESAGVLQLVAAEVGDPSTRPDALVHCGDFAYDLDTYSGRNGDRFLADVEPIAARVPYMTSQGNHERAYNFSHYAERFTMPAPAHRTATPTTPSTSVRCTSSRSTRAFFWPVLCRPTGACTSGSSRPTRRERQPGTCVDPGSRAQPMLRGPKSSGFDSPRDKPEFDEGCRWEKQAVRKVSQPVRGRVRVARVRRFSMPSPPSPSRKGSTFPRLAARDRAGTSRGTKSRAFRLKRRLG